jgi:hypothetical protein
MLACAHERQPPGAHARHITPVASRIGSLTAAMATPAAGAIGRLGLFCDSDDTRTRLVAYTSEMRLELPAR